MGLRKPLRERLLSLSCSSIRLFACYSATSTRLSIMKFHIWDAYKICGHVSIMVKIGKSDTLHTKAYLHLLTFMNPCIVI